MNWYVVSPLWTTAFCLGSAAWFWLHGPTDWFGIGLLVGMSGMGLIQSVYRLLLQMCDREIASLRER